MCDPIVFFVKFLPNERVHSFVNEGILYMNSLKYFRDEEEKEARGDDNEGISYRFNGKNTKFTIRGVDIGGVTSASISYTYEECINIFCMTAIRKSFIKNLTDKDVVRFNSGFRTFGDTAIIIPEIHIESFIKKINTAFMKNKYLSPLKDEEYWAGAVKYVDDDFSGQYGAFKKNTRQLWQSEWRIAFLRDVKDLKPEPYKFKIGSISDICQMIDTETLISIGVKLLK